MFIGHLGEFLKLTFQLLAFFQSEVLSFEERLMLQM